MAINVPSQWVLNNNIDRLRRHRRHRLGNKTGQWQKMQQIVDFFSLSILCISHSIDVIQWSGVFNKIWNELANWSYCKCLPIYTINVVAAPHPFGLRFLISIFISKLAKFSEVQNTIFITSVPKGKKICFEAIKYVTVISCVGSIEYSKRMNRFIFEKCWFSNAIKMVIFQLTAFKKTV